MRVIFLILLLNFTLASVNAQTISLKVLGSAKNNEYAESNGVIVSFLSNNLEVKKNTLLDSIRAVGVKSEMIVIEGPSKYSAGKKRFRIEESNLELFDKLLIVCSSQDIKIDKIYYKMPDHNFESQDANAIMAYNNAASQAKILSNSLNYRIIKVLNIDDDTTESSYIYDLIDKDTEHGKSLIRLMQLLGGGNNSFQTESSLPVKTSGYNLWVTFELKKNK